MYFLAVFVCALSVFHATDAFCERMYKNPNWIPKSLSQRAAEADIVIYGNVTESPCVKPTFINRQSLATAPPANATNSSSSVQEPTPSFNITEGNITDICFTRGLYNVSLKVHCVIKGGSVPRVVHLRALGFGPGMCTFRTFNYMETVQSFHVYKGLNYVIFLGRWVSKICLKPYSLQSNVSSYGGISSYLAIRPFLPKVRNTTIQWATLLDGFV